jgi:hypothetical protein
MFVFDILQIPTIWLRTCSPYYTCINIFNRLPDALSSQLKNTKQFLSGLKDYLVNRPYYTLQEFYECPEIAEEGGPVY